MKRPAFLFYPADWRNNANLRRCTPAGRGAWMDILCVLHDSDEYGIVRWPLVELASAANVPLKLAHELVAKSVLKGSDKGLCPPLIYTPRHGRKSGPPVTLIPEQPGPIWYSSRLVRDEYVRGIRGENAPPPKPAPKPPNGEDSSESLSASVSDSRSNPESAEKKFRESSNPARKGEKISLCVGIGMGNGSVVTIADPSDRIARFQRKIAGVLGPGAFDIMQKAMDPEDAKHIECLALCKAAAARLGKGWPHHWPKIPGCASRETIARSKSWTELQREKLH